MRIHFFKNPQPEQFGETPAEFLKTLGGPACLFFEGRDTSRTRALVTLLHGNEPSGTLALMRWIGAGNQPAVNVVCIVASVQAAASQPAFTHRMLPGARDLNRCFKPPFDDEQGRLAEEILALLDLHHPEAVVDMHNTSGSGPAFGVCTFEDRHHDALVSLFTDTLILSNLGLGALMDISEDKYPTVTIEVGGREDAAAHELAFAGMQRYFMAEQVLSGSAPNAVTHLHDPVRLEICSGNRLAYAAVPQEGVELTLRPDIESLNFGTVSAETPLGWISGDLQSVFTAVDMTGQCAVARIVRQEGNRLYPAGPRKFFMVTNKADIALSDCLLYAVAADGQAL